MQSSILTIHFHAYMLIFLETPDARVHVLHIYHRYINVIVFDRFCAAMNCVNISANDCILLLTVSCKIKGPAYFYIHIILFHHCFALVYSN